MPEISLLRILEKYPEAHQLEKTAAWLTALDRNQDGSLDASEVQGGDGAFRCDWLTDRMNVRRWRNLQSLLQEAGLVQKKRPHACGALVERGDELPVPPKGRFPAAYHVLFFANAFDRIFALSPEATLDKWIELLKPQTLSKTTSSSKVDIALREGGHIQFHLGSGGSIQQIHYLDDAGADSWMTRLRFLQLVRDAGLFDDYFSRNPYYEEEKAAWLRLYSPIVTAEETPELSLAEVKGKKSWADVLLFPDLHGTSERMALLEKLVATQKLDWLAMEMFSQPMQGSLDDFLTQPEASDAFRVAKKKIQDHLAAFWNPYFKKIRDPDKSPYYQLLWLCRKRGLRVVALDAKAYYSTASQKLAPLTIATRNALWAKAVPPKGRGIVFGGQAHFLANRKARVQDFLREQNSKRHLQLLNFSKK